jgi:hypothetical protein
MKRFQRAHSTDYRNVIEHFELHHTRIAKLTFLFAEGHVQHTSQVRSESGLQSKSSSSSNVPSAANRLAFQDKQYSLNRGHSDYLLGSRIASNSTSVRGCNTPVSSMRTGEQHVTGPSGKKVAEARLGTSTALWNPLTNVVAGLVSHATWFFVTLAWHPTDMIAVAFALGGISALIAGETCFGMQKRQHFARLSGTLPPPFT